jgi:hypothetical protein
LKLFDDFLPQCDSVRSPRNGPTSAYLEEKKGFWGGRLQYKSITNHPTYCKGCIFHTSI